MPEADLYSHEDYDKYIASEVLLLQGVANDSPIFDTRLYQVQFPVGHVEEFSANVIAQNIYSQLDSKGHRHLMLEAIVNYKKD